MEREREKVERRFERIEWMEIELVGKKREWRKKR